MTDKAWKAFERKVADITGGKRIPVNGRAELDVSHPHLGIECKYRSSLPAWLFKRAWEQATKGSKKQGLTPVICVKGKGQSEIFAVLTLKDLIDILVAAVNHVIDHTQHGDNYESD